MLQDFLTCRTLKRKLGTPKTFQGHSKGTWALRHSKRKKMGTPKAFQGHTKSTQALKALVHLDTQALGYLGTRRALGHSGTKELEHLGTRDT